MYTCRNEQHSGRGSFRCVLRFINTFSSGSSVCKILSSPPFFEGLRLSVFLFVMFNPHHQFLIGCVCLFVMFYHHHQFNRAEEYVENTPKLYSGLVIQSRPTAGPAVGQLWPS